ncbi:MAG: hypothetical protein CM1200mP20_03410 [Pseudomonadota bacterium]|nr:MAG: hypothetical protein CM1200mP20_03410 [Pseudomonadota bacterium]
MPFARRQARTFRKGLFGLFANPRRELAFGVYPDLAGEDQPFCIGRNQGGVTVLAQGFV